MLVFQQLFSFCKASCSIEELRLDYLLLTIKWEPNEACQAKEDK
jgi:hypothetical protein